MKLFLSLLSSAVILAGALSPVARAEDYPPAFNYDNILPALEISGKTGLYPFAHHVSKFEVYTPGRNFRGKISIVNSEGKIISSREYIYGHKNGQSTSKWKPRGEKCEACLKGPDRPVLKPGLYWLVLSENNKPVSAEWFEVRTYALGEGRFAAGKRYYLYAPQSQMARLNTKGGDFRAEIGLAGEKAVGKESSLRVPFSATLKYNGKTIAKTPGNSEKTNLFPYTNLRTVSFTRPNYKPIKAKDLKDGRYQIDVLLNKKGVRRYNFVVKGGKIQDAGRQRASTQPEYRKILSETGHWLWNSYAKEPERKLPTIDWANDPSEKLDFTYF